MVLQISDSESFTPPAVLWDKAWNIWQAVGHEKITQQIPSTDILTTFVTKDQSQEDIDQFFTTVPNQTFLLSYLEIFPLLSGQLSTTVSQLSAAMQVFRCVLLMPISRDVSPFLVPSISDGAMTSVQRQIINCLSCLMTSDEVFEPNKSSNQITSLMNKTEISDLQHLLILHTHSLSLFEGIFRELLLYASYSWTPVGVQTILHKTPKCPVVLVHMLPFSTSCLVLAVQLLRGYLSHDSHVMSSFLHKFLEVSHCYT